VEGPYRIPTWAPRVRKNQIERLYKGSANGVIDEALVDEVGHGLYARCQSMLEVTEIRTTGRPRCPECSAVLPQRTWAANEMLRCPSCAWMCTARAYDKTYSRKNLGTGGLDDSIREFMKRFESTRSYGEKLVLIDTLIHLFHWSSDQGRPLATALIEGDMKGTMAFLDRLSYDDNVPEDVNRTRAEWRRAWAGNGWSHGRGQ
jgi:ribosomal protein L37AE/L43A